MDYSSLSNEKLAGLANEGDEDAMSLIIERTTPIVRAKAAAYLNENNSSFSFDDLVQEGLVGVFKAIKSFSTSKEASFSTYASVCIVNRLNSVMRTQRRQSKVPVEFNSDVANEQGQNALSENDPQEILLSKETVSRYYEIIQFELSAFERDVAQLLLEGASYREAARTLGTSAKAIDNGIQRIRKKLKSGK